MNNQHKFKEEEIPYGILEKFGLTREMIGDLPQSVLQQVCDGYRSPVLPIHITDEGGNTYKGAHASHWSEPKQGKRTSCFIRYLPKAGWSNSARQTAKSWQPGKR